MNRFVTLTAATAMSAALVACSGSAPTSPSSLGSPTPAAQFPVIGDSGTGGRISAMADIALNSGDAAFVASVAQLHQALVQAGMAAEGRVAHPRVKWFAQQMEQEGRKSLASLRALSSSAVPQNITLSGEQQQIVTDVTQVTGNPADRVYTQATLPQLEALLAMYQQRANASGSASELREHAADVVLRVDFYIDILRELVARVR